MHASQFAENRNPSQTSGLQLLEDTEAESGCAGDTEQAHPRPPHALWWSAGGRPRGGAALGNHTGTLSSHIPQSSRKLRDQSGPKKDAGLLSFIFCLVWDHM